MRYGEENPDVLLMFSSHYVCVYFYLCECVHVKLEFHAVRLNLPEKSELVYSKKHL